MLQANVRADAPHELSVFHAGAGADMQPLLGETIHLHSSKAVSFENVVVNLQVWHVGIRYQDGDCASRVSSAFAHRQGK